ncbi:LEAF RUST 10 DISEASE-RESISTANCEUS RECEPTOR-LIKE PROTEIN KINASE-like 1.1 isoform X2 [Nicotiana tomentosiformis]|uniref:LEAF RUST 10 DISEASE-RESISTANCEUS RECEPTOR-LIKE PROTEIN KINASE-like 1.1 isoform X2 n=1 Tax=Nicotiana tomentosiformis TaxID=4098 RepID=UPI00388CD280
MACFIQKESKEQKQKFYSWPIFPKKILYIYQEEPKVKKIYRKCLFQLLIEAQGQNTSSSSCTKEFQCGSLGNLSFPFYKSTQLDCGLCKVDCEVTPNPIIELEGVKYQALEKHDVFIKLKDFTLEHFLKNKSCQSFDRNLSLPISPSITYRVNPFLTLFKCNNSQKIHEDVFNSTSYQSYNSCESFILYYSQTINYFQGFHLPTGCSFVQLPKSSSSEAESNDLFDLLTDEVTLGWTVSDECNQCYYRGGKCQTDNTTKTFLCYNTKGNTKVKVIVAVSAFIGLLFGLCTIASVIWFCKRRKNDSSPFLSRNTSGASMLHQDLEEHSQYLGIPVFTYRELEEATNKFNSAKQLGDGGYGTVYYGKLRDGKEVAVKRLYEHNHKQMQQFINEIEILTRLRHRNLVILYGCTSRRSRELFLVYEYIPNGTIADHLHGHRAKDKLLTWPIRLKIAIEIASALAYLHASDIIHRDVKTNNILLDNDFCVKVADFGLSKLFPNDVTHISTAPQGTPGYVDPQYHECYQLTDKSDVYSFGVVLVELISSMPAVDMNRHMHEINLASFAMNRILKCAFNEVIDPALGFETNAEVRRMTTSVAELAFQCLQAVKDMRPKMEEVLETLKTIKEGEWKNYHRKEISGKCTELRRVKAHHPSETEDAVLLKKNIPASPDTVIDTWASSSTTTSTGG